MKAVEFLSVWTTVTAIKVAQFIVVLIITNPILNKKKQIMQLRESHESVRIDPTPTVFEHFKERLLFKGKIITW